MTSAPQLVYRPGAVPLLDAAAFAVHGFDVVVDGTGAGRDLPQGAVIASDQGDEVELSIAGCLSSMRIPARDRTALAAALSALRISAEAAAIGRQAAVDSEASNPIADRDLKEAAAAQEALARSEERLALAQTAGRIGVFDWDMQRDYVVVTHELEKLHGFEPGTFGHKMSDWWRHVPPQDVQRVTHLIREHMKRRASEAEYEFPVVLPDGRRRLLAARAKFLYSPEGKPVRMVGVNMDVTDVRQAQAALEQALAKLRLAQRAARAGMWYWNIKDHTVEWSDEYYEVYGLDRSVPATFENWIASLHPDDRAHSREEAMACIRDRREFRVEHRVIASDGIRWIAGVGQPILDESGETATMTGIVIDITAQKQAEEKLRQSNEDLQRFAYVVSHDLQEPLRMISAYSSLLMKRAAGKFDEETNQFLLYIGEGTQRMAQLVRDLLEYSRVTHNAGKLSDPVDLNRVVQRALEHLEFAIADTHAEIHVDPLPHVCGNELRLTQVFQNLIANALKYRSKEPVRIRIEAQLEGTVWKIGVRDNGIGFDMKQSDRIFGLFKRLHATSEYGGTGIGLAIVKRIVEQHGGRVWADSKPGAGSTFYFTLPQVLHGPA